MRHRLFGVVGGARFRVFAACAMGGLAVACGSDHTAGSVTSDAGGSTGDGTVGSTDGPPDGGSSDTFADAGTDGERLDGALEGADVGSGTDSASSESYKGPCDVLTGGCAEAYGVARGMRASYAGPLFQLGRLSDKATLDVGQTSGHMADMTTWSAFCGGVQSNCVVSKIYAQVQAGGNNDLVPSVFAGATNGPGPYCGAGGFTCAAPFTIEEATGLPILTTVTPQEYTLSNDDFAVGINGGSTAMSIVYNGKAIATTTYCCGVFGLTHKHDGGDTYGTDFMVALGYGFNDSSGSGVNVNCGTSSTYCAGAEEESLNDLADYGSSPLDNVLVLTEFDPIAKAVSSYVNGNRLFSHSPPKADINAGTAIHLGGGGDLSQPDPVLMREALIANTAATASDAAALYANVEAFYPMFP
jgi:hypothetical protein